MALSLIPQQVPEQRMHIVTNEEIMTLGEQLDGNQPSLEHYFSPTRKEHLIKERVLSSFLKKTANLRCYKTKPTPSCYNIIPKILASYERINK